MMVVCQKCGRQLLKVADWDDQPFCKDDWWPPIEEWKQQPEFASVDQEDGKPLFRSYAHYTVYCSCGSKEHYSLAVSSGTGKRFQFEEEQK